MGGGGHVPEKEEAGAASAPTNPGPSMGKKKGSVSVWTIFKHADGVDLWLMALGFLGAAVDGLSLPLMLVIISKIMNNLGNSPSDHVGSNSPFVRNNNKNALDLVYLACGLFVAAFLEGYCWTRTGERQAARTRARYLKAVLRQDVGYFDRQVATSTSEVVTSVSNDTLVIQDTISEKVPNLVMNLSTFFGSYIAAFLLSWRMALVALPFLLLLLIPGLVYGRMLMNVATKIRLEYNKAGIIAEQAISSIRTVYSFVGESKTMTQFSAALQGSVKLGLRQGLAKGLAVGSNSITFAIWAFMSWYGSRLVMYHGALGGTIFAVGAAITVGGLAFGSGLANVKYLSDATSAGERILEVIKRVPLIDSSNMDGQVLERVAGEVEFRDVEFAYPARPDSMVFKGFSLRVPAGQTVALVGGSGSGKSTAIALLERFYDPASGEIMVDGVDVKRLQLKWLRSQMGLVSQEPALFATTIKENILFGKEDATMEEVEAAAKVANAHNFITQLPQGYDTQVGERGVQMSGGQKQRIAIARAIIKGPHILLLDEATSALDTESERIVQDALDAASLGRTTLLIAHRLSTIRNANTIAVVQDGRVMETGAHDDLICIPDGLYSSLVHFQQTAIDSSKSASVQVGESSLSMTISSSNRYSITSSANSFSFDHRDAGDQPNEDEQHDKNKKQHLPAPSFWRLLRLNAPEWKQACVGCLSATSFGAVQPIYAYVMGSMIFIYFLQDHDEIKRKIRSYSIFFLSLAIYAFLVNIVQHYNFAVMGEKLTKRVRERMLSKILTFEVGWFDEKDNSTGAICSRLAKDTNVVRSLVGDRTALMVQAVSAVAIACVAGLIIAWRLALVMIAAQPLIILCFYARRVLLKSMSQKAIKAQDESSKLAAEAVSNLRTVTAFSSQDRILHLFEQAQQGPRKESIRQAWYAGLGLGFSQSLMSCTWALDFWYGGKLVAQGLISGKELLQTFMILVSTGRVIADAGSMTTDLAKGADAVATVFAVLDRYTLIEPDDVDGHRPDKLVGRVELKDVHFAYPSRPNTVIFKCFSLDIEAGRSTALVGPSGSGKSTIISLIERFYDPIKGCVMIDGIDIGSYHLKALRKHIALVSQEPTLFAGSIKDNITYGVEEEGGACTDAEVEAAARTANAHEFISGLKDGFETWCGERGVQLSGGQKQRIAIARAILKNPGILLLDEATSALDSQSEKVVQEALEKVMVGRTSVVVAHRLSTVRECDLIAVMEEGRVVEKGTHSSLLAKGPKGTYFGLVALQHTSTTTHQKY